MYRIDPLASIKHRANMKLDWLPSDSEENYKATNSAGLNEYSKTDIKYVFNEDGFRCDSFNQSSPLPILFMGCSITEGIGLHLKDVWSSLILEKIKAKTGLNIPYWSIALGGTGLDTTATWLAEIRKKNLGIKYIFIHCPPFTRREFFFEGPLALYWPTHDNKFDSLFADQHFAMGQAYRSLMIISLLAEAMGAKIIFSYWGREPDEYYMVQQSFPNFKFTPQFIFNIKSSKSWARDGIHPGTIYHQRLAEWMWNSVQDEF